MLKYYSKTQHHVSTSFTSFFSHTYPGYLYFSARSCYHCHYHLLFLTLWNSHWENLLPEMLNLTRQRNQIIVSHYPVLNTNKPFSHLSTTVNHCRCSESTCYVFNCFLHSSLYNSGNHILTSPSS